jgi:hypothetical protein
MKIQNLTNGLIKGAITVVILGAIVGGVFYTLNNKIKKFNTDIAILRSQTSSIKAEHAKQKASYDQFTKRYNDEFLKIPQIKRPDSIEKLSDDLLKEQAFGKISTSLVKKLDLYKPQIKLLPKTENQALLGKDSPYKISSNNLEISFKAKADSFVYSFIKNLQGKDTPGYILVNNLEIKLINDPNQKFMADLERTGILLPLIETKMTLSWHNFTDPNNKLLLK